MIKELKENQVFSYSSGVERVRHLEHIHSKWFFVLDSNSNKVDFTENPEDHIGKEKTEVWQVPYPYEKMKALFDEIYMYHERPMIVGIYEPPKREFPKAKVKKFMLDLIRVIRIKSKYSLQKGFDEAKEQMVKEHEKVMESERKSANAAATEGEASAATEGEAEAAASAAAAKAAEKAAAAKAAAKAAEEAKAAKAEAKAKNAKEIVQEVAKAESWLKAEDPEEQRKRLSKSLTEHKTANHLKIEAQLGLPKGTHIDVTWAATKKAILLTHPDKNRGANNFREEFEELNKIKEILKMRKEVEAEKAAEAAQGKVPPSSPQ